MAPSLDRYAGESRALGRVNGVPAWVARARADALDRFLALGFPTSRDEEWRFTSVAPIAERTFVLSDETLDVTRGDLAPFQFSGEAVELVFVNGRYAPMLSRTGSLPTGVRVESLASALAAPTGDLEAHLGSLAPFERHPFTALNTAFLADGACIRIAPHLVVDEPINIWFMSKGRDGGSTTMSHPRLLVVMGEGSQASIVESYAGVNGAAYLTNAVAEIDLAEGAVLEHYKVQRESMAGFHVGSMYVRARQSARFTSHSISLGGALVRNDVTARLDGEGVECTLNGLYLADEDRLVDNHTTIDHARPHCGSREVYKGILADRSRGVFNGKIVVRPEAQKTDAKQTNRALLLSEDARINTKPQLEIFANDVKCTHGAAVGQLDDEAVFYLRSRGLGAADARHLLVRAFAADVLNRVPREPIRASVEAVLFRQLSHALGNHKEIGEIALGNHREVGEIKEEHHKEI